MAEEKSSCRTEIYYPDGRVLVMEWEDGTCPGYEWLTRAVGGYLQPITQFLATQHHRVVAFCDEEGLPKELDVNLPAMKALLWPAPPEGWDLYERRIEREGKKPPKPGPPILITSDMTPGEARGAWEAARWQWSPACGPVVILWGWNLADLDEKENLNPESLGEPRA